MSTIASTWPLLRPSPRCRSSARSVGGADFTRRRRSSSLPAAWRRFHPDVHPSLSSSSAMMDPSCGQWGRGGQPWILRVAGLAPAPMREAPLPTVALRRRGGLSRSRCPLSLFCLLRSVLTGSGGSPWEAVISSQCDSAGFFTHHCQRRLRFSFKKHF